MRRKLELTEREVERFAESLRRDEREPARRDGPGLVQWVDHHLPGGCIMRRKLELTEREVERFAESLRRDEREPGTIEAYLRSLRRFAAWAAGRKLTKELLSAWKAELSGRGYRPESVNAMLAAVNKFFVCMGRPDCKVKYLKVQRRMFRRAERELTKAEYRRLVETARACGKDRLADGDTGRNP